MLIAGFVGGTEDASWSPAGTSHLEELEKLAAIADGLDQELNGNSM